MPGFSGSPFPTRGLLDMLNSPVVQSDGEVADEWNKKIGSISPTIDNPGVQLINGAEGFNAAKADPYRNPINDKIYGDYVKSYGEVAPEYAAGLKAVADFAKNAGVSVSKDGGYDGAEVGIGINPYTDPGGLVASSQGMSQFVGGSSEANPAYAAAIAERDRAMKLRQENNIRQQQAYDTTMMGNGGWGGILPDDYADPNYGQVTGQAEAGADATEKTGGLGGLGGFPSTEKEQTGFYNGGGGAYSPLQRTEKGYGPQSSWNAASWGVK